MLTALIVPIELVPMRQNVFLNSFLLHREISYYTCSYCTGVLTELVLNVLILTAEFALTALIFLTELVPTAPKFLPQPVLTALIFLTAIARTVLMF